MDWRNTLTQTPPYRLGLPAWAFPGWKGRFFPPDQSLLASYASVFNAVEGNTTFYRIPDDRTVALWREAVHGRDFRFCFKLPRSVTHERHADFDDLRRFLNVIEPLGEHLGPLLVQLPATVGPSNLPDLERLFDRLPGRRRCVIEVRDRRFFEEPALLRPLLDRHRLGRVVLDARPLHEGDRDHPDVRDALHKKPDLPVLPEVEHALEFVRLVLHPDLRSNDVYIREWAPRIARSILRGDESYMMIHCPAYMHCPPLAETFHDRLRRQRDMSELAPLAPWPVPQQGQLI